VLTKFPSWERSDCLLDLVGGHSVKDKEQSFSYIQSFAISTILNRLTEKFGIISWVVWVSSTTITSKVIELNLVLCNCLACMSSFRELRLPYCKHKGRYPLQGVAKDWGQKFCLESLTENGDWLNESNSQETTILMIFRSAFKLHSHKGLYNFEGIFKYHSV